MPYNAAHAKPQAVTAYSQLKDTQVSIDIDIV